MAKPADLEPGSPKQRSIDGKWIWNGTSWVPAPVSMRGIETVSNAVLGSVTPDSVLHGVQRGDTTKAAGQRALAEESRRGAAEARADEARHRAIASRDPRVEGDKDAATRAAAQYQQRMSQISGAAGGGAAALASMNVQDPSASYAEHRQRMDEQQIRAEDEAARARGEQQEAITRQTRAEQVNEQARNDARHNNAVRNLSLGGQVNEEEQNGAPGAPVDMAQEAVPEAELIERVQEAIRPFIPSTPQYDQLYTQGLNALKAYFADPPDTSQWARFKATADAEGIKAFGRNVWEPVNDNPRISKKGDNTIYYDEHGKRTDVPPSTPANPNLMAPLLDTPGGGR